MNDVKTLNFPVTFLEKSRNFISEIVWEIEDINDISFKHDYNQTLDFVFNGFAVGFVRTLSK